ncbi:MAG: EamA family transporter [Succinivibrio sp.]
MSATYWLGLLLGLFGAACQAANYSFTKDCQEKSGLTGIRLLLCSHAFMCAAAAVPFLIFGHYRAFDGGVALRLCFIVAPYFCGQYFTNAAIAASDSSVVSPLLTVKIPILAVISVLVLGESFTLTQALAAGIIVIIGVRFSCISGRISPKPLLLTALGALSYCVSDLSMAWLMRYFGEQGVSSRASQVFMGITFEYVACGAVAALAAPLLKVRVTLRSSAATWKMGTAWLLSMVGIVGCFNLDGVVAGNIVQSLRAVIGVLIAYVFYRKYIRDPGNFRRKLAASFCMIACVCLYYA